MTLRVLNDVVNDVESIRKSIMQLLNVKISGPGITISP